MAKDFWRNSRVAVIGGGSFGTVLCNLAARNSLEVRLWVRSEEQAREINATRVNARYVPDYPLVANVQAVSEISRALEGANAVVWALPSKACREMGKEFARHLSGEEILIHCTKGIEEGSMKRISEVLREELPCPRIGVLSGPNLATEIARGEPAATVIASSYQEVLVAGQALFASDRLRMYTATDVIGIEWAGTLKNILAIASGAIEALGFGWNARAMLITRGLAEMVRFGVAMGARESTFLGLAGVGDLLATCSSPLSRNYRVGLKLARGEKLESILRELGSTAEGVRTARIVHEFAVQHGIAMPITEAVYRLVAEELSVADIMKRLMSRPNSAE